MEEYKVELSRASEAWVIEIEARDKDHAFEIAHKLLQLARNGDLDKILPPGAKAN